MKIPPFKIGHHCLSNCGLKVSILAAAIGLSCQLAAATEPTDHGFSISSTEAIRITADKMIAEMDAGEVEFFGNVKALQSGTVITANRLKIVYDASAVREKGASLQKDSIRKIIASGRVRIVSGHLVAEGDSAEYTIKSGDLILSGKPSRVNRDGDLISGSKFTLQRSDGTLTVEGSQGDRVRAIFNAD